MNFFLLSMIFSTSVGDKNIAISDMFPGYGPIIPDFVRPIENTTVNVGREAVLECFVNHLGRYKVGWLKAKDQTILALHKRVITHNTRISVDHEDNKIWKLKIRHVQENDRGCYMCQINTEQMKKQIGCIDVLIPPDIDDKVTSSDVIVNEGEDALLSCHAKGHPNPEIIWSREDKAPFSVSDSWKNNTKRFLVSTYKGESLIMKKVSRSQMGAYLCIASNNVPPAVSKRILLSVNFAPEINVPSQLYGVSIGTNVTVTCGVQAYPHAINYWMKNDSEMIIHGHKYSISEEVASNGYERTMKLTIKNWEKFDESHFACMSTNSLGKAAGIIQSYTYKPNKLFTGIPKKSSISKILQPEISFQSVNHHRQPNHSDFEQWKQRKNEEKYFDKKTKKKRKFNHRK